MPYLILSSLFCLASKQLRKAADECGWKSLRLEHLRLPKWFEIDKNEEYAFYFPVREAYDIARLFSMKLLGCDAYWLANLPKEVVKRGIYVTTLEKACHVSKLCFIKPAMGKSFRSGLYDSKSLSKTVENLDKNTLVCISEPVKWIVEYRCFIVEQEVISISSYARNGEIFLNASQAELEEAKGFAYSIVRNYNIAVPPSFVLDVGIIENKGWAVIETNECWASGIYNCDPKKVLKVLLKACISGKKISEKNVKWDSERHYFAAYPGLKS